MFEVKVNSKDDFFRTIMTNCLAVGCCREVALFIASQFALESNYGQSRIASSGFNLCGMKSPVLRPSFNLNGARTFASYPDYTFCLADYFLWLAWNKCTIAKLQDLACYIKFLKDKKYCPEPSYIDNIMGVYHSNDKYLTFNSF